MDLACPVVLDGPVKGTCINVSDGGVLVPLEPSAAPPVGNHVKLRLAVPRSTPNTYMPEQILALARVIRHEADGQDGQFAVAFQFDPPLNLGLMPA